MDVFRLPDNTMILFPDIIRGATLPTGSKFLKNNRRFNQSLNNV